MAFLKFDLKYEFLKKLGEEAKPASSKAAHSLAVQVQRDTKKYVPALNESLANRTQVDGDTIIYPGPYARYLYHGKLMVDSETGSAWGKYGATKVLTDRNLVFNKSVHSAAQDHWFEASKAQNLGKWKRVAEREFVHELKKG